MKNSIKIIIFLLFTASLYSCTPPDIAEDESPTSIPTMSTGDDSSVRPDNDRDG